MTYYKVLLCTGAAFPPDKNAKILKEEKVKYKKLKKAINGGLKILTRPITYNHNIRTSWIEIVECKISKSDESKKEHFVLIIAPNFVTVFGENRFVPQFIWYKSYSCENIELKQQLETTESSTPVMDELSVMEDDKNCN